MKEIEKKIRELLRYKKKHKEEMLSLVDLASFSKELEDLQKISRQKLTPWQRVQICRHPQRPQSSDYIREITDSFEEIHGDRLYGDDKAIIGGIGYIGGKKFVIIGQEKGKDTEARLKHNFGMPHPEGYRKALRLMELAEKFQIPVVTLIDTPGAYPGLAAEERGQGWAIAKNLWKMARLKTPIISVVIGEGCSGGALGIGVGDAIAMLEHSYYSVISPEGCASILWKDAKMNERSASMLKMHAEHLLELSIIDTLLDEPTGGAHNAPEEVYKEVKQYILDVLEHFVLDSTEELLEKRYQRFRRMGVFFTENLPDEGVEEHLSPMDSLLLKRD